MQLSRFFDIKMQSRQSVKPITTVLILSFAGACLCLHSAEAKSAHKSGSTARSSDGVVIKRNADGTVEAYDTGSSPEPLPQSGGGGGYIQHTHAPRAYSRTIGGVHVHKNADGTVETYEAPSPRVPLYSTQPHSTGKSSKSAHHRGRSSAGSSSQGDVKVKRNADGTVETSD